MKLARISVLTTFAVLATAASAQAGGLEANGYNWDLIFDPATYAAKATIANVNIDHEIDQPGGAYASNSLDRVHYNLAVKADFSDAASCLISAQNPWGSGTERDATYALTSPGGPQAIREEVTSFDAGLTCAYGVPVGPGVASIIGGVSAQTLGYDAEIPTGLPTGTDLNIAGSGVGWRTGVAYEIEDIALRVSAIYNASVAYDLSGSLGPVGPLGPSDADASVKTPQSIELKAQTGVAPGWLVLGSVKWVDWSELQALTVSTTSPVPGLGSITSDLSYRDGWTITGGVAHTLTDDLTVLGTVTWDRGTSSVDDNGVLLAGHQTDRWGLTLGGAYEVSEAVELSGGVSYSMIEGGENARGETWDDGSVLAISASLKASF